MLDMCADFSSEYNSYFKPQNILSGFKQTEIRSYRPENLLNYPVASYDDISTIAAFYELKELVEKKIWDLYSKRHITQYELEKVSLIFWRGYILTTEVALEEKKRNVWK